MINIVKNVLVITLLLSSVSRAMKQAHEGDVIEVESIALPLVTETIGFEIGDGPVELESISEINSVLIETQNSSCNLAEINEGPHKAYYYGQIHPSGGEPSERVLPSQFTNLLSIVDVYERHGRIDFITEGIPNYAFIEWDIPKIMRKEILDAFSNIEDFTHYTQIKSLKIESLNDKQKQVLISYVAPLIFTVLARYFNLPHVYFLGSEHPILRPEMVYANPYFKEFCVFLYKKSGDLLRLVDKSHQVVFMSLLDGLLKGAHILHKEGVLIGSRLQENRVVDGRVFAPMSYEGILAFDTTLTLELELIDRLKKVVEEKHLAFLESCELQLKEIKEITEFVKINIRENYLTHTAEWRIVSDEKAVIYITYGRAHQQQSLANSKILALIPLNECNLAKTKNPLPQRSARIKEMIVSLAKFSGLRESIIETGR